MVEVGVSVDESDGLEAEPGEGREHAVRLAPRVEDDGEARVRVGHDRAVAAERGDGKGLHQDQAHAAGVCHTGPAAPAYTRAP